MFGKFLGITGLEELKYLGAECTRCGTLVMLVPEKVDLSGSSVPLDCPNCRHADKDTKDALGQVRENVQSINTPGFRAVQGRLTDEAGI